MVPPSVSPDYGWLANPLSVCEHGRQELTIAAGRLQDTPGGAKMRLASGLMPVLYVRLYVLVTMTLPEVVMSGPI